MAWLEQRHGWLPGTGHEDSETKPRRRKEPVLRVGEAANILGVDYRTMLKYLSEESGDDKLLRFGIDWFRLPSGRVRIYRAAIERLTS